MTWQEVIKSSVPLDHGDQQAKVTCFAKYDIREEMKEQFSSDICSIKRAEEKVRNGLFFESKKPDLYCDECDAQPHVSSSRHYHQGHIQSLSTSRILKIHWNTDRSSLPLENRLTMNVKSLNGVWCPKKIEMYFGIFVLRSFMLLQILICRIVRLRIVIVKRKRLQTTFCSMVSGIPILGGTSKRA